MNKLFRKGEDTLVIWIGEESVSCSSSLLQITDFDWNRYLSPWPSKKVFSQSDDFVGQADVLIDFLGSLDVSGYRHVAIGGYSLAGLFAVYACTKLNIEGGISCSGSFWYPYFLQYMQEHPVKDHLFYLSLGIRESHTRHPVLRTVEERTESLFQQLQVHNTCTYVLEKGSHFTDTRQRIERGIAWMEAQWHKENSLHSK